MQSYGGSGLNFRVSGLGFLIIYFFLQVHELFTFIYVNYSCFYERKLLNGKFNTKSTGVLFDANGMFKQ